MILDARPILLVEDDRKDIELILAALKGSNIPNEIITVRDGEEALDYVYRRGTFSTYIGEQPIAILLDLNLPKVDGLDVLQILKSDPDFKSIPIIMLTSSLEENNIVKSYHLGVNAYVVKPVEFEEFTVAIREIGLFWTLVNQVPQKSN